MSDHRSPFRFPELIQRYMKQQNLGRSALAEKINRSAEHVRKLETGRAFPGPDLEEKLVTAFQLDRENASEFKRTIKTDRWIDWFGEPPQTKPSPLEEYWGSLTDDQRATLRCVAECLARLNRR